STMVTIVATINKDHFGGRQLVTCWTCHRNRDKPLVTPTMDTVYGMPPLDSDDVIVTVPGLPAPESILDRYIQSSGGAQRLAGLTSFVAKGTSVGFGGFGGGGNVEIVAKAPDKRATIILFKEETGLLIRELRYGNSPLGRVPTQIDYADYRDVNGIKLPFRITYAWLDGRDSIVLNEIQTNVAIDEAKFGRPAPLKPR